MRRKPTLALGFHCLTSSCLPLCCASLYLACHSAVYSLLCTALLCLTLSCLSLSSHSPHRSAVGRARKAAQCASQACRSAELCALVQQQDGTADECTSRHRAATTCIIEALQLCAEAEVGSINSERQSRRQAVLQRVYAVLRTCEVKTDEAESGTTAGGSSAVPTVPATSAADRSCQVAIKVPIADRTPPHPVPCALCPIACAVCPCA